MPTQNEMWEEEKDEALMIDDVCDSNVEEDNPVFEPMDEPEPVEVVEEEEEDIFEEEN